MIDEWGPWIEHDGVSVPNVIGMYVAIESETIEKTITYAEGIVTPKMVSTRIGAWIWEKRWVSFGVAVQIILRYRVRKPRALLDMIEMVENLPEQVDA